MERQRRVDLGAEDSSGGVSIGANETIFVLEDVLDDRVDEPFRVVE